LLLPAPDNCVTAVHFNTLSGKIHLCRRLSSRFVELLNVFNSRSIAGNP
jgi:hypothetical protein